MEQNRKTVTIYTIVNDTNLGDNANSRTISEGLSAKYINNNYNVVKEEINVSNISQDTPNFEDDKVYLVITAGERNLQHLENLPKNKNISIIWSGHQFCQKLKNDCLDNVWVLLPYYVLNALNKDEEKILKNRIIPTIGVSHDLTKTDIDKNFNDNKDYFTSILDKAKCIIVILAGDAPNENGEIQFYTTDEARELAKHIKEKAKEMGCTNVLVTNGPRTGKYNPKTGKENDNNHKRNKLTGEVTIDEVTRAFIEGIKDDPTIKYETFNFVFEETSLYKSLIGFAIKKGEDVLVYVPGESSSMIGEAKDFLPGTAFTIYRNNAMNPNHTAHVNSLGNEGFNIIDFNNNDNKQDDLEIPSNNYQKPTEKLEESIYNLTSLKDDIPFNNNLINTQTTEKLERELEHK